MGAFSRIVVINLLNSCTMDYTRILDETRDVLNDLIPPGEMHTGSIQPGRRPRMTDQFSTTFMSIKTNFNETTFVDSSVQSESAATLRISKSFADVLTGDDHNDVLEKVEKFVEILKFELSLMKKSEMHTSKSQFLRLEMNTWLLVLYVFQNRLSNENVQIDIESIIQSNYSPKVIIDSVTCDWGHLKELSSIVEWLELTFVKPCSVPPLEFTYLEKTMSRNASGKANGFLYHLDAEIDSEMQIEPSDLSNTNTFMKYAFWLIRNGKFSAMEEIAKKMGSAWLPMILEGRKPSHDSNYGYGARNLLSLSGNKQRDLWNLTCSEVVKNPKLGVFEKAIYAYCSGNIDALLPACKTWEDKLWCQLVCLKASIEDYAIHLFADNSSQKVLDEPEVDLKDILMKIDALGEISEDKESLRSFFRGVQTCFILNSLSQSLISKLACMDSHDDQFLAGSVARFSAACCIIASQPSNANMSDYINQYVLAFGEHLITSTGLQSVCAIIPFLSFTTEPESICFQLVLKIKESEHNNFLDQIQVNGLDVGVIRKKVIAHFQGKYNPESYEQLEITADENLLIESTLKLSNAKSNPIDFICSVNSLGRTFFGMKRYCAAYSLFSQITTSIVDEAIQFIKSVSNDDDFIVNLPAKDANVIGEFLNMRNASAMIKDLDQIRQEFNITNGQIDFEDQVFATQRELLSVIEKVYDVLLQENGWLNDENETDLTSGEYFTNERKRQIELIRSIVLPDIIFKSIQLLKDHKLFEHAQNLFICVMNEDKNLVKVFTPETLELLNELLLDIDVIENVLINT